MSDIFGKKLGQYVLLEQLGEGGMAKVYNALDERVEKNVAIKVILPNKLSSQVFLQQFDREAKALANLTHTNIVKVLNYGTDEGQPYLVMDFIQGGTLKDAMTGILPWQKSAEILAPIARALDYVHQQNIVHQDIKPSNILLDEEFRPMLSDFGVVKLLEAKEGENAAAIGVGVGTPDYMSPEQGMGKDVDFRADIYSLGVVFYEMVTGVKPFVADTPMAVVIKHVTEEIPLPSKTNHNIPKFVESAILRAVQKNPEDRYTSMDQFADVLELIALGEHAPEKKILSLTRNKKRRTRITLFVMLSVLVLAGLAFFLVMANSNEINGSFYGLTGISLLPKQTAVPVVLKIYITTTVRPGEAIMISATPKPVIEATPLPANNPLPTPTSTMAPAQSQSDDVTLLGTPISKVGGSGFVEIARWGIGGVNKVRWSPNGDTIAVGTTSGIFLYDSQTKELKHFINAGFNVIALTFSPEGSQIIAGSLDGQVKAWYSKTGEYIRNYSKNSSMVNSISFSKNKKNIIIGYDNGDFIINPLDQDKASMSRNLYPSAKSVLSSGDERFLYVSNNTTTIFVWDIGTQKQVADLALENKAPVNKLAISADRQFLLAAGDGTTAYLWDLTERRLVNSFVNLGGHVTEMDFIADASLIAIGLDNGQIRVFTKPEIKDYSKTMIPILIIDASTSKLQSIAFSPTQSLIATGNWDDGLKIWDAKTGDNVKTTDQSMSAIKRLEFSPEASWLASVHEGNVVRIWDVQAAREAYRFDGYLPKGEPFSPDGRFLAVIQTPKNTWDLAKIQIVELSSGTVVRELLGYGSNFFLQFSDDTKILVTGISQKATIWDVSTWEKVSARGEPNAGCGQFYTPENNRLSVISSVGILFTYSPTDANMCGTKPKGTTFVYYFKKQRKMMFVLGDGRVWAYDFISTDISKLDPRFIYPSPGDVFLAANQESGIYASVSGNSLFVKNISGASYGTISGQDDYAYQAAFLPTQKIFALGSKYGSIHIWTLP